MAKYKFGDIVKEVKINIDRANNPYEFYVAGDHMDTEDLVIRRRGKFATDDVGPAFTRIFKPGQILYGSRRTYLKKVAVADFEGICANTTFVLETKDSNILLQELLPYIMLSDSFTEWSVSHSKGSTNPYVLFSDLAEYEVELPSIAEQRVLSNKLLAAQRLKESYRRLLIDTDELVKSQFIEMFGSLERTQRLGDLFSQIRNGANIRQGAITGGFPITRIETISDGTVNREKVGYAGILDDKYKSYYLEDGDVLVSHINSMTHIGKCALYSKKGDETIIHGMNLLCLRPLQNLVDPLFIIYLLRSDILKKKIRDITKPAVNQASFTVKNFSDIRVFIPSHDQQREFTSLARQADKSKFELKKSIEKIDNVIKALMQ